MLSRCVSRGKLLPKGQHLSPNEGIRRSATYGLLFALLVLGFGLLVLGLLGGLVQELITVPLYGPTRGVPEALSHHGLLDALVSWLSVGLPFGLFVGLPFGLIGALLFGLAAAVQHSVLRLWLWQAGCTPAPWQYVAFLDDTVEQLLLRKVGGGYVFRHRLLRDYFASLEASHHSDRGMNQAGGPQYSSTKELA